jgi:hypothetical protein
MIWLQVRTDIMRRKVMSNYIYDEILDQAQRLTPDEQLRLVEDLVASLRRQGKARPKHSIMELRGLGKELWKGVDVEKYINEERNSWDG